MLVVSHSFVARTLFCFLIWSRQSELSIITKDYMRMLLNAVWHFRYIFFSSFTCLLREKGKRLYIEIIIKIKKIKIFQINSLAYSAILLQAKRSWRVHVDR